MTKAGKLYDSSVQRIGAEQIRRGFVRRWMTNQWQVGPVCSGSGSYLGDKMSLKVVPAADIVGGAVHLSLRLRGKRVVAAMLRDVAFIKCLTGFGWPLVG